LSISSVSSSSSSIIENALEAALAAGTQPPAPTNITTVNAASNTDGSTSSSNTDALTQDLVKLLKALANGNTPEAKSDLAKLKKDLNAEQAQDAGSASLGKDVTSLLKDLTSGNSSAAKRDATRLQADLKAEDTTASPLHTLVSKISDSLSSGSIQAALHDLAGYLVQNGHSAGGLVNTSA
jgi:hypothetical protein